MSYFKTGIFLVAHTKVFSDQFRVFVGFCGYVGVFGIANYKRKG